MLGKCVNGKRFIPVKMLDVAGLVPGASEGRVRALLHTTTNNNNILSIPITISYLIDNHYVSHP